jgi:hypothetical protein
MVSQSGMAARSRGRSSGPFTPRAATATAGVDQLYPVIASNLPFGSSGVGRLSSKAHLPHVSALSGPGTQPGIRPVIRGNRRRSRSRPPRFPVTFRPPAFASWASFPTRGFRPAYDRPTAPPPAARTRAGFPRSARTRPGWDRASSVPRGRRCRRDREWCPIAACRFATARPCHPGVALRPGMCLSRGISKDSLAFARPAFPSPVAPQTERATLGLSPELPTSKHRMPGRRSGQGQVFDTDLSYVSGISQPPPRSHSQRATSCRNHR